ncbi:hypothetical protein GJ629_06870 [Halapricum sp. CBA1109]|uniref:hypothetical protein n=1 Tax=Halapricum sp. CBA1109 TaxID=2668068 RepID=UPI0012FC2AB7|nr:hypothetical protein [Halapricum sp. CBA1109]MUV89649.1 hypothetical protein [Halapricum sp. CBA1109]
MTAPARRVAQWLADRSALPTSGRAVAGYYADTGVFDVDAIRLKRTVDDRTETMIEEVFGLVEDALADHFDADAVTFGYDTKLVLPAQLTLGHVYRTARQRAPAGTDPVELGLWADAADGDGATGPARYGDPLDSADADTLSPQELVDRAEYLTRLVIEALIDGDMRDAVNDAEYEDFEVSLDLDDAERAEAARIAQQTLQSNLEATFERVPDAVRDHYEWAVDVSEAHQDRDEDFRAMYERARDGEEAARESIREEYRDAPLDVDADRFADGTDLPYFSTQYARVGVIYDGMVEMYREAGLPVDPAFKESIVLSIIGAQIWLDDLDDYAADLADGQLTPVTAEYVLQPDDRTAYEQVVDLSESYLDTATAAAARSDAPLAGIAADYIYYSGDPSVLPGSE